MLKGRLDNVSKNHGRMRAHWLSKIINRINRLFPRALVKFVGVINTYNMVSYWLGSNGFTNPSTEHWEEIPMGII